MAIGTPWVGTAYASTTAEVSATIDITGATTGQVVYIFWAMGKSQSGPVTCTGWTSILDGDEGTSTHYAILRRVKQAGDTTFSVTWPTSGKAIMQAVSWPGVNTSTPDEGAGVALHTTAGATFTTQSATPTSNDRWAVTWTVSRNSTGIGTWTPDAALTERSDFGNASSVFCYGEINDSNGAVTQAAHTYTNTSTISTENHGFAALFYLIPGSTSVTGNTSGSGTLTASGTPSVAVPAGLSGSGTLTTTAQTPAITASGALSGSGTLTASVVGQQPGSANATLSGTGTLSVGALVAAHQKVLFTPPSWTYQESHGYKQDHLFGRLKYDQVGYTILKTGGFYKQVVDPDAELITAADIAYLGGHVYPITEAEATALTNAGYGSFITRTYQ